MSEKGGKKKTIKNNKKATKDKKLTTLKLNDDTTVVANTIYDKKSIGFVIDDVDLDKIKVSNKKLYSKKHDSYNHYVFYEHNDKHIPLKIILLNVTGRYYTFNDDSKTMNFILNDDSLEKIIEIFENIEAKLGLDINDYTYDSDYATYFKTKASNKTCFRQSSDKTHNILPREKTGYNCRILLQIESVFFNNKNKDDIDYYAQVFLQEFRYTPQINRTLLIDKLELIDVEPESESEEEEFNENTA